MSPEKKYPSGYIRAASAGASELHPTALFGGSISRGSFISSLPDAFRTVLNFSAQLFPDLGVAATQLAAGAGPEYWKGFSPLVVGWNEVEGRTQDGGQNLDPAGMAGYVDKYLAYIKQVKPLGLTEHITPSESGPLSQRFVEGDSAAARPEGDWVPKFLDECCNRGDECTSAFKYYVAVLRGDFRKLDRSYS